MSSSVPPNNILGYSHLTFVFIYIDILVLRSLQHFWIVRVMQNQNNLNVPTHENNKKLVWSLSIDFITEGYTIFSFTWQRNAIYFLLRVCSILPSNWYFTICFFLCRELQCLGSVLTGDASKKKLQYCTWLTPETDETPLGLNGRIGIAATIYESWKGNSVSSVSGIKGSKTKYISEVSNWIQVSAQELLNQFDIFFLVRGSIYFTVDTIVIPAGLVTVSEGVLCTTY